MKRIFLLIGLLFIISSPFYSQINTFPYTESFEDEFTYGNDIYFLTNWWGNIVQPDTMYQDESRPYSGSAHLTMIPQEEELKTIIEAELDLTGMENVIVEFYAASESNLDGSKSTRLFIETSNDGGVTWFPKIEIGGQATFPNASTPYSKYYYAFHSENFNKESVIYRMYAKTGVMQGAAAKLLIDDLTFFESSVDSFPPQALEPQILAPESILVLFSEPVGPSAEDVQNYIFSSGVVVNEAILSASLDSVVLMLQSPLTLGLVYDVTISGIMDTSGNVMETAEFEILYNDVEDGLVISEIFYDEPPEGENDFLEFIEIYNATCEPIQLGGLRIKEAIFSSRLPFYLLDPGEYFVLAKSNASFQAFFGFSADFQWKAGNLDNEGNEYIQFLPAEHHSPVLVDSVVYQITSPWPLEAAGGGPSIELGNNFLDNTDGANWSASTSLAGIYNGYEIYATPGQSSDPALNPVLDLGDDGNYCGLTTLELDAQNEGSVYLWSTGDTTKTISINESGVYSVIVNNGYGAVYDTITVSLVPDIVANWEVPETTQCHSSEIQFTDLTEDAVSWLWDFGDDNFAEEQNPIHVFDNDGTYSASLIVSNSFGCTDTLYTIVEVSEIEAAFGLESTIVCVDESVFFTDMSVGALTWAWDFGDGFNDTVQNPIHFYSSPESYMATLIVSNSYGCTDTINSMIEASQINASIDLSSSILCVNTPVNFYDASNEAVSWNWEFGDGSTDTMQDVIYTYTDPGEYVLSLSVDNIHGCTDIAEYNITVSEMIASTTNTDTLICVGSELEFIDNSAGAVEWNWDFGDGTYSTLSNPIHVYNTEGEYMVSLTASNNDGCSGELSFTVTVNICSGIEEQGLISAVQLYPNPSNEKFELKIQLQSTSDLLIEIIDIHGRLVFNDSYINVKNVNKEFNTIDFGKGVYLIKISAGQEFKWEKLIIN